VFFGGGSGILFQFEFFCQSFDLILEVSNYNLILAVGPGLVVLDAAVDGAVEVRDDGACFTVEISEVGVFI
jgi:hypothetical protein